MPKIMMVNTVLSGSHGRLMRDLKEAAQTEGYGVRLAFGRGAGEADALRIGGSADVYWHVAMTRLLDRHALHSRRATRRFLAALDGYAPDLVHLHNVHGYYLDAPELFGHLAARGIPVVWTHHDCWALTGHCSHFLRAGCMRWQAGCHDCPLKREYPASLVVDRSRQNWRWKRESFALPQRMRIVAPSAWLDGVLAASTLAHVPRQVIHNGVDLGLFRPVDAADARAQTGVLPGQRLLLAVASPFDHRKGLGDAIALASRAGDRARVALVGLSERQIAALPGGITGIRRTAGPETLVQLYAAADCLINPTHEDTYPTVTMEAMACGTPVAGYAVGGATEQLLSPGGQPVRAGDVAALTDAALRLAADKPRITAACRAQAERAFDRRAAVRTYMALYQTMLGA